jgi:hypothetical protein
MLKKLVLIVAGVAIGARARAAVSAAMALHRLALSGEVMRNSTIRLSWEADIEGQFQDWQACSG